MEEKLETIELDMAEWPRPILEMLITLSCEQDVSVNKIITDILKTWISHTEQQNSQENTPES